MLQMLINFIFNIVLTIVQLILSPFLNVITALFPDLTQVINSLSLFFTQAITYVSTILHWFFFEPSMWILLFDYYVIKYSIYVIILAFKFTINMYNKLKP